MATDLWRSLTPLIAFLSFWGLIIGVLFQVFFGAGLQSTPKPTTSISITSLKLTATASASSVSRPTPTSVSVPKSTTTESPKSSETLVYPVSKEGLLAAAAAGSSKDVVRILKQGIKPSVRGADLRTPLHLAAENGDEDTVAILLRYEDTGWFADGHITPLQLAARYGNTEAVRRIASIKGHDWPSERVAAQQSIKRLQRATGHKFDKHLQDFFESKTFTARELAVMYGHEATLFAFPSASNDDLLSALSCACMLGNWSMVETIWDMEKSRSWRTKHSYLDLAIRPFPAPPLHLAVMSGDRATVSFFLEKGFNVKDKSSTNGGWFTSGWPLPYSTPAHYAAIVGDVELLLALERRGADLTALDYKKRTPLSYAVESLNESAVELLTKRKRKYKGTLFMSSRAVTRVAYLGEGDILLDYSQRLNLGSIRSKRIQQALKEVGFV